MKVASNLSYNSAHKACQLDLFTPSLDGPFPTLIMLHGGGWISGDKSTFHSEAEFFVEQGLACACVSYRLAPLNPFPAACDDVLNAVKFLRSYASDFNLDPNSLISFGNSAGGHLSCIAGLQRSFSDGSRAENVNAVVTICPITDVRNPDQTHFPISMSFLEQFMGSTYSASPSSYEAASPVTHISESAPPFLIFHGDKDDIVPVEQSKSLYMHLCQVGVAAELQILPGEGHSFTLQSWLKIRNQTVDFVNTL